MTTPLYCLLGMVGWTLLLVLAIGAVRSAHVLRGEKQANEFPGGTQHGGDAYWRLNRAHLNATENLALFAAVVLTGTLAGVTTPLFSTLAQAYLAARVVQSIVHVSSGSARAVLLRFSAFAVQVCCVAAMGVEIVRHA